MINSIISVSESWLIYDFAEVSKIIIEGDLSFVETLNSETNFWQKRRMMPEDLPRPEKREPHIRILKALGGAQELLQYVEDYLRIIR
ncbi:MAG: hypothetical protein K2K46_02785 [Lachnospiraceae bacterium]|nr:hypothetical protein [Lachnospiraceae bacterium]